MPSDAMRDAATVFCRADSSLAMLKRERRTLLCVYRDNGDMSIGDPGTPECRFDAHLPDEDWCLPCMSRKALSPAISEAAKVRAAAKRKMKRLVVKEDLNAK